MINVPKDLKAAAEKAYGTGKTRPVKVRTFLSFGAQRRGAQVATDIRAALKQVKLVTEPDFMTANIEERIRLRPYLSRTKIKTEQKIPSRASNGVVTAPTIETPFAVDDASPHIEISDPTPRLGTIFGGRQPVSVNRDAMIREAVTIMVKHDFSQLPVMQNKKDVVGIISWKTIGEAFHIHRKQYEFVRECMDTDVAILESNTPLWKAIKTIADNDVVLVRDGNKDIASLLTTYDLSDRYHTLAEPFLLLGEIENNLRQLITLAKFPQSVLEGAKDPNDTERVVNSVSNLTLGEYVRLLEKPGKLEMPTFGSFEDGLYVRNKDHR